MQKQLVMQFHEWLDFVDLALRALLYQKPVGTRMDWSSPLE
jgi:hypothetical protein